MVRERAWAPPLLWRDHASVNQNRRMKTSPVMRSPRSSLFGFLSTDDGQSGRNGAEPICNALADARRLSDVINHGRVRVGTSTQPANRSGHTCGEGDCIYQHA